MSNSFHSLVKLNHWDVPTFIEIFVDGEYEFLTKLKDSQVSTIVDCGANVGFFAVYCSFHFKDANFICHEPVDQNRFSGVLNTSRIGSVIWKSTAVSNCYGMVNFTEQGPGSKIISDRYTQESQANVGLIDLFEEYKDNDIDILKLDIEGAELAIISDERFPLWSQRLKCIALEWHNLGPVEGKKAGQWYLERLEECGFSVSLGNSHGDWSGLLFGTRR